MLGENLGLSVFCTHQTVPLFAGWVNQAHSWAAASCVGLRQISWGVSWEGQRGKWILSVSQDCAAFVTLQLCCSEVQTAFICCIWCMMHLLLAWMHKDNSDSKAGFSQSHLVSSGTSIQRCPKRIKRRNYSLFLSRVCFSIQKGSGKCTLQTLQNTIEKSTPENFCHWGRWFNSLNSQQNRSQLLNWKGEVSYSYSTKEKAGCVTELFTSLLLIPLLKNSSSALWSMARQLVKAPGG